MRLLIPLFVLFFTVATIRSGSDDTENRSIFSRIRSFFGGSSQKTDPHKCPTCKTGPGTQIQNAYVIPGSGGSAGGPASPTSITNMFGNSGSAAQDPQVALLLEKERTRQLEMQLNHDKELEDRRGRWVGAMKEYETNEINKRHQESLKQQKELQDERLKIKRNLQEEHHKVLNTLEEKRGKAELEKEKIRQQNLPQMLQHDLEKTTLTHKQFLEKLSHIGNGLLEFTGDKQRMTQTALVATGLAVGIYGAKHGTKAIADVASAYLLTPPLVTDTSRIGLNQIIRHPIATFFKPTVKLPEPIYPIALQDKINTYIRAIKYHRLHNEPIRHGLLYGPPGTGKTLLAKTIALSLGMDYAIVQGAQIRDSKELTTIFAWGKASRKGCVILFDEMDAIATNRLQANLSEESRKLQSTLYALTGDDTNKTLVMGTTNLKGVIDPAWESRAGLVLEFPLPDLETRIKLLQDKFNQSIVKHDLIKCTPDMNIHEEITEIAEKIEGFSGRDIRNLTSAFLAEAYSEKDHTITTHLLHKVVRDTLEQKNKLK